MYLDPAGTLSGTSTRPPKQDTASPRFLYDCPRSTVAHCRLFSSLPKELEPCIVLTHPTAVLFPALGQAKPRMSLNPAVTLSVSLDSARRCLDETAQC